MKMLLDSKKGPKRLFKGITLRFLLEEAGYKCSNPFCDFGELPLQAHHLIEYSRGGLTIQENGLILCSRCHQIVHKGCLPRKLLFSFKTSLKHNRDMLFSDVKVSTPESLIEKIRLIDSRQSSLNQIISEINEIIIEANFLQGWTSRYKVFLEALLAKASIFSDGVREVRSNFTLAKKALDQRRARVALWSAWASFFAKSIRQIDLYIRARHFRAISYNARRNHKAAVKEYRHIIDFINSQPRWRHIDYHPRSPVGRIFRELGVTRLRTGVSYIGKNEVHKGLELALERGEPHDIWDARVRLAEASIYMGEYAQAESIIGQLYDEWDKMDDDILRALTMEMDAKLKIATCNPNKAKIILVDGAEWCRKKAQHHEEYVFTELLEGLNNVRT